MQNEMIVVNPYFCLKSFNLQLRQWTFSLTQLYSSVRLHVLSRWVPTVWFRLSLWDNLHLYIIPLWIYPNGRGILVSLLHFYPIVSTLTIITLCVSLCICSTSSSCCCYLIIKEMMLIRHQRPLEQNSMFPVHVVSKCVTHALQWELTELTTAVCASILAVVALNWHSMSFVIFIAFNFDLGTNNPVCS